MELSLEQFTATNIYSVVLIFCRVCVLFLTLPGVGAGYVSGRIRLFLALLTSVVLQQVLSNKLPNMPPQLYLLAVYIVKEIVIGMFLGLIAKVMVSGVQIAGSLISAQSSLSSASLFDPINHNSDSVLSLFLTMIVLALFFIGDLHHLFLKALIESYNIFPINVNFNAGNFAEYLTKILAYSMVVGFKLSMPFIIVSLLTLVAGGVLSRLMPNMQVFFILNSMQILVTFTILSLTVSVALMWYMEQITEVITMFPNIK